MPEKLEDGIIYHRGRMLDDQMPAVVHDLEERRRLCSWRAA